MPNSNGAETLVRVTEKYNSLLETLDREINSARQLDGFRIYSMYTGQMEFVVREVGVLRSYHTDDDKIVRYWWAIKQLTTLLHKLEAAQLKFLKDRANILPQKFFRFRRRVLQDSGHSHLIQLTKECAHWVHIFARAANSPNATVYRLRPQLVGILTRMQDIQTRL